MADAVNEMETPNSQGGIMCQNSRSITTFMSLPAELRRQIYDHLLGYPDPPKQGAAHKLDPAILLVSHQINEEATPHLYSYNTFIAHYSLLTSLPRLRAWFPPVVHAQALRRIGRWWVRVRLDTEPQWETEDVTRAFSGMESVVLELWQPMFLGSGPAVLKRFHGVRGIKNAAVVGSTTGFEGYARWLQELMMMPVGFEVSAYTGEVPLIKAVSAAADRDYADEQDMANRTADASHMKHSPSRETR
jgi:hypothetical protein